MQQETRCTNLKSMASCSWTGFFSGFRQGQRDYMSSSGTLKGLGVQIGMNPASVKVIFY